MTSLGVASLEKTLGSRQKSESELVPLNSARGVVRPMETIRSLNFNLIKDNTFVGSDEGTSENLGSPVKHKLTERTIGPARTMNRVKSYDKISNIPKTVPIEETILYDNSVLCSNPKIVTIEDKIKKINLLTNPGENKRKNINNRE
jgi:hypothetical protein